MGRHKEAIKLFQSALKIPHKGDRILLSLAWALAEEKRFYEAEDILNKAITRNPKNPESHYALGWTYQGLGRMPLAVQSYQEALRLNPSHSGARFKLNRVQAEMKGKDPVPVSTTPASSIPVPILEE